MSVVHPLGQFILEWLNEFPVQETPTGVNGVLKIGCDDWPGAARPTLAPLKFG
jgi:hypothetical protein